MNSVLETPLDSDAKPCPIAKVSGATPAVIDQAYGPGGMARAASIVSLGNVASSLLGLGREMVKSNLFGASGAVSAYNVAAILPS